MYGESPTLAITPKTRNLHSRSRALPVLMPSKICYIYEVRVECLLSYHLCERAHRIHSNAP